MFFQVLTILWERMLWCWWHKIWNVVTFKVVAEISDGSSRVTMIWMQLLLREDKTSCRGRAFTCRRCWCCELRARFFHFFTTTSATALFIHQKSSFSFDWHWLLALISGSTAGNFFDSFRTTIQFYREPVIFMLKFSSFYCNNVSGTTRMSLSLLSTLFLLRKVSN